jgi:hypothetical protein
MSRSLTFAFIIASVVMLFVQVHSIEAKNAHYDNVT